MATDTTTTTNMAMVLPTPSVRIGNQYAVDINAALTKIDSHNHSAGLGALIPPSGLNINADLNINAGGALLGNNLTGARSVRFVSQTLDITNTPDVAALYVKGGNLWFNQAAAVHVQLTQGGSIVSVGTSSIVWPKAITTVDLTIAPSDAESYLEVDSSTGPRVVTLPIATGAGAGRFYWIVDSGGQAGNGTNFITVNPNSTLPDTIEGAASLVMQTNSEAVCFICDGISKWRVVRSSHELNGARVPKAGALTTGHVLTVTGTSALTYAYVVDANVGAGAAISGSKLQAAGAANYGVVQLNTDFGGTAAAPNVVQLTGAAGVVAIAATELQWPLGAGLPAIRHVALAAGSSTAILNFIAQNAGTASGTGGSIRLTSGSDLTANETFAGVISFYRGTRPLFEMRAASNTDATLGLPTRTVAGPGNSLTLSAQAALTSGSGGSVFVSAGAAVGAGNNGGNVSISASAGVGAGSGGSVSLNGGAAGASGLKGSLSLSVGTTDAYVQLAEVAAGRRSVTLCKSSAVTTTELPANTGDGVIFIANCVTAPTAPPTGGALLYVSAGQLYWWPPGGIAHTIA